MTLDYIGAQFSGCWDFVARYYREQHDIDIDPLAHRNRELFDPVDEPQDGDLALIQTYGKWSHAGIVYCRGILHHTEAHGVIYQRSLDAKFYRCRVRQPTPPAD